MHWKITAISCNSHAIGITCENSCEILIYIGINSSSLTGADFKVLPHLNNFVYAGTPNLKFNLNYMLDKDICPFLILVLLENANNYSTSIVNSKPINANI
ncbi:PTS glucose transporter subunit IIA [Anaerorhabdus sp.]|uniref:PTS glucose transporter subunit IIA n=1 Tax=Anaerorhabdus sp. TaxID=1872524 RepID=UPI003FA5B4C0